LCIIQGDRVEWELEMTMMDETYENSLLTIAVQEDDENGFLPRPTSHKVRDQTQDEAAIYAREIKTPGFLNPVGVFLHDRHDTNPGFVYARGWCYQERYLSSQILHFTADEVLFEFNNAIRCQCGNYNQRLQRDSGRLENDYPSRQWRIIIREYSQLATTDKWDLLPGIAGIARRFALNYRGQLVMLVAGLWLADLARWLCWKSVPQFTVEAMRGTCDLCRPWPKRIPSSTGQFVVPSFSWASRFGPCKFPKFLWESTYTQTATVFDVENKVAGENEFGRITKASILLTAPCRQAFLYSTKNDGPHECEREFVFVCDEELHDQVCAAEVFGGHWHDIVAKQGGWEIAQDAADDIPVNGTEVLSVKMFEGDKDMVNDAAFDDMPGPITADLNQVKHLPESTETACDVVALVLLKQATENNSLTQESVTEYRRIGIVFFTPDIGFLDIQMIVLK
jgi:hypothetical protein